MKRFLADLFAGRLSFWATMALGALPVTGFLIFFWLASGTFGNPGLVWLLLTLGSLLMPVAIWRSAIKFQSETDKIGAMGCAIMLFMLGLVMLLILIYIWGVAHI